MPIKNQDAINFQKYFLIGVLLLLIVILAIAVSAFFSTLVIAAILVTAVYPFHRLLTKKVHIPASLSALLTLILVAVVFLGPFMIFFFFIAGQATDAVTNFGDKISSFPKIDMIPAMLKNGLVDQWIAKVGSYVPITTTEVMTTAKDFVTSIGTFILGNATGILKNLTVFFLQTIVFLFAMFYFLKDGERFIAYINSLMPMSEVYRKELFNKLSHLSYGIIYGLFGSAIAQGLMAGLGFYIVGINNAAFWGSIAALFSVIPYIGTAIIWVPVAIYLLVTGHWIAALFLLAWSLIVVSTVDNMVKPFLIGSSATLHPFAVLIVLFGSTFAFGLKGLIFGPFILTLTLAFLHIYELEFKGALDNRGEKAQMKK
jgi:predicted PurR-regulated permease PerM